MSLDEIGDNSFQDNNVIIAAPKWVENALKIIRQEIRKDIELTIEDRMGRQLTQKVLSDLTLKHLQMMARNESSNKPGIIDFGKYQGISDEVVFALKDLVRQTVIVGSDRTTHYGGYPKHSPRVEQIDKVFVCDLIGLDFRNQYNSGRLVLIGNDIPKGLLDDLIYKNVVGEEKPSLKEAANDINGRYHYQNGVYFDQKAYKKFVAKDVLITGLALNECADRELNLKFLKYGTGYFAGHYKRILESLIGQGVAEGLALLLPRQHRIKAVELPFFTSNPMIDKVCEENKVRLMYGQNDALQRSYPDWTTATTNCSDGNASAGNAMGFGSIDGCIAENLESKAKKFSPIINQSMREIYFN